LNTVTSAENAENNQAAGSAQQVARPGGLRSRTIRNAIAGWAGFAVDGVSAFLLTPYLLHHLGDESYGVWLLIGAFAGYLGFLDFGLRGAVGRFIALNRGRGDRDQILATINSALVALTGVGLIAIVVVSLAAAKLHWFFEIPPEKLADARLAMVIVGVQLGAVFPMCVCEGVLWGHERLDLHNLVDGLAAVLRAAAAAAAVSAGFGLVGLAWTTLAVAVVIGISKSTLCYFLAQPFALSWRHVRVANLREISNFGFWNFLLSISGIGRRQLTPMVVGNRLGPAMLPPFSIAARLVGYASQLLVATVNVLTPALTALVGQGNLAKQSEVILRAGKICAAYSLYAAAMVILAGQSFLTLWLPEMGWAAAIASILAIGEWLPMSVHPYNLAVVSMAKQRPVAWRGMAELAVGLALAVALGWKFDLIGISIGLAAAAIWFRGIFMLFYGHAILGISPGTYMSHAVVPVVIRGGLCVATFSLLTYWRPASTVLDFLAYCGIFTIAYWALVGSCIPELDFLRPGCVMQKLRSLAGHKSLPPVTAHVPDKMIAGPTEKSTL
jgi:O-antigen/teichoic acid export membrane protein